jgi:hypothetical protein
MQSIGNWTTGEEVANPHQDGAGGAASQPALNTKGRPFVKTTSDCAAEFVVSPNLAFYQEISIQSTSNHVVRCFSDVAKLWNVDRPLGHTGEGSLQSHLLAPTMSRDLPLW